MVESAAQRGAHSTRDWEATTVTKVDDTGTERVEHVPAEDANVVREWMDERARHPMLIVTEYMGEIRNSSLGIYILPWSSRRDAAGGRAEQRVASGYEPAFALVRGTLNSNDDSWLGRAIGDVSQRWNIDPYSSLAFMAHMFLIDVDLVRIMGGQASLLVRHTWSDLRSLSKRRASGLVGASLATPIFPFKDFRAFWTESGTELLHDPLYAEGPGWRFGRVCFKTVPAIWLPKDQRPVPSVWENPIRFWIEAAESPGIPHYSPVERSSLVLTATRLIRESAELPPRTSSEAEQQFARALSFAWADEARITRYVAAAIGQPTALSTFERELLALTGRVDSASSDPRSPSELFGASLPAERGWNGHVTFTGDFIEGRNLVYFEGRGFGFPDAEFRSLLWLAQARVTSPLGILTDEEIAGDENLRDAEGHYWADLSTTGRGRLRAALEGAMPELQRKEAVERLRKRGLRLHIRPDRISWDLEKLQLHPDEFVRRITRHLIENKTANHRDDSGGSTEVGLFPDPAGKTGLGHPPGVGRASRS